MLYVDWFVKRMKMTFNTIILEEEVGYESYDFYHDELDDLLFPVKHLEKLPNPLLLETLIYVDESRNEWLAGVVLDEETKEMLYEVWIKNGEAIAYEIYI
ncbi:hypothetical protein MHI18_10225 [Peribacillus sp. FSL H8-0477]|uniref:hypothetical protein n=1 Tax=Peribacillus sp. FSL H8-0477 TaxID=2921388 RepID=UPI0030F7C216